MGKIEKVNINWNSGLSFEANVNNHKIILDAEEDVGGKNNGPRPKPLMLVSLAGCTGMDVISILKKMKMKVEELRIEVESELTDEHPKHYKSMLVKYIVKGKDINREKVEKAVDLSKEKYCGVSAIYSKVIPIKYEIIIET